MKIIVVDDEPKIRNGLVKLLSAQEGFEMAGVFKDAASALAYLYDNPVDVMITDIKMPETSGLELIGKIREKSKDVKIVILSGYSNFTYAQKAIELGVCRYMVKPTNPKILISVLRQMKESLGGKLVEEIMKEPESEVSNLLVSKAIRYIEMNYDKKISLKDVADELYISPNYFCELFKRHTGKNLSEYLTDFRLVKSKGFLNQIEYRVSDVAGMVGYNDSRYFSNAFKKAYGMTPLDFRNSKIQK